MSSTNRSGIVLLHGIARRARSLRRMEQALLAHGYEVLNLDYPSRSLGLSGIADALSARIAAFERSLGGPLHFVTHSMGGLVARVCIGRDRPETLGRIVMLAPPNEGSEIADLLAGNPLYRAFFGPAGAELITRRSETLTRLLGTVDYPLGVIAGDRSLYPLASMFLSGANDGRVTVARTKLAGMADHIVLPTSHPFIAGHPAAIAQTLHFLAHGRFKR